VTHSTGLHGQKSRQLGSALGRGDAGLKELSGPTSDTVPAFLNAICPSKCALSRSNISHSDRDYPSCTLATAFRINIFGTEYT
jgi:hypothetical protein